MADTLLPKIKAIGAVNQEIIERINAKKNQQTSKLSYHIYNKTEEPPQFQVQETKELKQGNIIVAEWKKAVTLKIPIDLFKDRVDYKCETFADVMRLNEALLTVIEQYHFLDPTRAQPELEKFKNNFEVLQTCLGEVEGLLQEPVSMLKEFQVDLDEINKKLLNVIQKKGAILGPPGPPPPLGPTEWWDRSDNLGGIRQSTHDPRVYFLVSKSNVWDKTKNYVPPQGYRWMTTAEGKAIFNGPNTGQFVYRSQGGWTDYTWNGLVRHHFIFSDSTATNSYKHAGNHDPYPVNEGINPNLIAGIVCMKS